MILSSTLSGFTPGSINDYVLTTSWCIVGNKDFVQDSVGLCDLYNT